MSVAAPASLAQDSTAKKYSPEVVAKAESILTKAELRRSGKTIQATNLAEISRAITSLAREKRQLRLVAQQWKKVSDQISAAKQEVRRLNAQDADLSLQLTRVAPGDLRTRTRIVNLINAARTRTKVILDERDRLKEELASQRGELNDAESQYAEMVLAIRKDFSAARERIAESLQDKDVQVALKVMHTNFGSPSNLSADQILSALDKRIARIEQEIFSESIDLDVEGGSLYTEVVVGKKTTRMVVDSGATLISLPARTAAELDIKVPNDAPPIRLVLADGRSISARRVTLPRVRIGEFEAENVDAAVLDASANFAEP
ncbi:MAG: aspartyl protease family protein, partial [Pirellulales bacterium]|nr:aspartyl protease family protein [Pirellulales bacterium]